MTWISLACPQCSAPLPRVAIWRAVKCASCGSLVSRAGSLVKRDDFRQALARSRAGGVLAGGEIRCAGESYRTLRLLGRGEGSEVHLARRLGPYSYLATLKVSGSADAGARYAREAEALRQLRTSLAGGASLYASWCLPEVIAQGRIEGGDRGHALVLRHPYGYWGSLAALCERFPGGIDPRHAVWIWRRMLDTLHFIHGMGWSHGGIRPEHALVHPRDHAVRLIGWDAARGTTGKTGQAEDLARSALTILVLLAGSAGGIPGSVPGELSTLVERAGRDEDFCGAQGARGLDALLRTVAREAFGPPTFVHLIL